MPSFIQPAVNANVDVSVANSSPFAIGQDVFHQVGGNYQVIAKPNINTLTLKNLGAAVNPLPGATITNADQLVTGSGPQGAQGTTGAAGAPGAAGAAGTNGTNGIFSNVQVFVANGNFTVPAGVTKVFVECFGGGGGAGDVSGGSSQSGAGGGAYAAAIKTVVPAAIHAVVVGAAGAAGGAGVGGTGGTSSILTVSAPGGVGQGAGSNPGAGGVAAGGDLNFNGQPGALTVGGGAGADGLVLVWY